MGSAPQKLLIRWAGAVVTDARRPKPRGRPFIVTFARAQNRSTEKERHVSKAARSVLVFGVYLVFLGVVLIAWPNLLLRLFGIPVTTEVWIRVVGMLVLCLAFYYILAARRELGDFLQWTVYARSFVFVSLVTFALLRLAQPPLALFGVVDLLGAIWTEIALRQSDQVK